MWTVGLIVQIKPEFSNFPGLKRVFEKLRFPDGLLIWTVGLNIEIKTAYVVILLRFEESFRKAPFSGLVWK